MTRSYLNEAGITLGHLILGCEQLGGTDWGNVELNRLHEAVNCAWDFGIRSYDTADVYGLGRSEEQLRKALGSKRHEAVIISKFGMRWGDSNAGKRAKVRKDASPRYVRQALEASLRRLGVETISIYLLHWPDSSTPLAETLEALEGCRVEGKILSYGLSNIDWQACEDALDKYPVAAIEGKYSLIEQMPGNVDYAKARALGVDVLAYGPLAQGLLSGKYSENITFGKDDRRHRLPQFLSSAWPRNKRVLKVLNEAAKAHAKTPAQVALRWIFEQKIVSSVIVGAKNPSQVVENIGCGGWELDPFWIEALSAVACNDCI